MYVDHSFLIHSSAMDRMTQRDGVGREVEGAFRMGNTCKPMAESCQCMAKTTTMQ